MSGPQNKGTQFFLTTVLLLISFLIFYLIFIKKDEDKTKSFDAFKISYIDDRMIYLSDLKAEETAKVARGVRAEWAPDRSGIFFLDNYEKLKYQSFEKKESIDIAIAVSAFSVCPTKFDRDGAPQILIAYQKDVDPPTVTILSVTAGAVEEIAQLGPGSAPRFSRDGSSLAFIRDGNIHVAASPTWEVREVLKGNASDLDISPDGEKILFTERKNETSKLFMVSVPDSKITEIKSVSTNLSPDSARPEGYSLPRFFNTKNEALIVLNDAEGGNVLRLNLDDYSLLSLSSESWPIYSLSISGDDATVAYFFINFGDQPKYIKKADESGTPIEFGPNELNSEFTEKLAKMGADGELSGDEINRFNVERIIKSNIIRIVDINRSVYWIVTSGQYPILP